MRPTSTTGLCAGDEPDVEAILDRPECAWINREIEQKAQGYAIAQVVPKHLDRGAGRAGSSLSPRPRRR